MFKTMIESIRLIATMALMMLAAVAVIAVQKPAVEIPAAPKPAPAARATAQPGPANENARRGDPVEFEGPQSSWQHSLQKTRNTPAPQTKRRTVNSSTPEPEPRTAKKRLSGARSGVEPTHK